MTKFIEFFTSKKPENEDYEELREEMAELSAKMQKYEQQFNMTDNEDLIEALIYEQKAMQSRFSHLVKQAREVGLEIDFFDRY
ncbi:MAG: DUF2508 family protein [Oscillospiraceae bacterium]|nr:DUF2508 family protein [Oscillospiraceae bacterium]